MPNFLEISTKINFITFFLLKTNESINNIYGIIKFTLLMASKIEDVWRAYIIIVDSFVFFLNKWRIRQLNCAIELSRIPA